MTCRVCGRANLGGGKFTVRWYVISGTRVAELLCWRCFTWSDSRSPVFGHRYATL